jgi:surface protein
MSSMFQNAIAFNQNLSSWDVGNVTTFSQMFQSAANFNGDLSGWNTANATTMSYMFSSASKFNQNLNSWNVSKVSDLNSMFMSAVGYKQCMDDWDTSNVRIFQQMFHSASTDIDCNFSRWNITNVTTFSNFVTFPISAQNYTAMLIGWASQDVKNNVTLSDVYFEVHC